MRHPESHFLRGDGLIPNNERLPLLVYRSAVAFAPSEGPALHLQRLFASNGWHGAWVNGIYPFHHYHARSHEVLGLAEGSALVQFGGPRGPEFELRAGDAVVIPAGVAHCRKGAGACLVVVGAYPRGQERWDLKRESEADYQQALREMTHVALPDRDPLAGAGGPLLALWR